jgi:transcriptional regulator with XRE-family HTH domain
MEDIRVGAAIRAVRLRRGLRQLDVASLAGVSQSTVSLVERGHLGGLTIGTIRAVAKALDVWLPLEARWRGAELPRLIDERHAAVVEQVVRELAGLGWEVRLEYSFNVRGERGSVDVLAWLPSSRALLVVEVKTQIVDVQELLSTLDRKRRVVASVVAGDLKWNPAVGGCLVVLPEETRARAAIARHAAVFASALPARTVEVRQWLRDPSRAIAGLWFLRYTNASNGRRGWGAPTRVRRPSSGQLRVGSRSGLSAVASIEPSNRPGPGLRPT